MSHFDLLKHPNPESLAQAAAAAWLDELGRAATQPGPYLVALSGGRIAARFLQRASELGKASADKIFRSVHFFWGDERCVPPDDPESNFGMARQCFLQPLRIPEAQIHRIRGEDQPELAAAQAEAELCSKAQRAANGQPVIDLVFLGMGPEGHVCSLFPGEPEDLALSPAVFRPVVTPKPPPRRITLGYPALAAARQVWLLASGEGKEEALRESLAQTRRTPLARVLAMRSHTRVFTDLAIPT
ncbi:MAG TPA: 6-phosphogluconolactonase [Verrucomicrobiae bacterium]|nr:6-phosphogluconolactonase [Verrucomicrobiae bacterium]